MSNVIEMTRKIGYCEGLTFHQVIERLRDGGAYDFGTAEIDGFFYKAPYPADETQTKLDGACSAVTFWRDTMGGPLRSSPVLLLHEFDADEEVWWVRRVAEHPYCRSQP